MKVFSEEHYYVKRLSYKIVKVGEPTPKKVARRRIAVYTTLDIPFDKCE